MFARRAVRLRQAILGDPGPGPSNFAPQIDLPRPQLNQFKTYKAFHYDCVPHQRLQDMAGSLVELDLSFRRPPAYHNYTGAVIQFPHLRRLVIMDEQLLGCFQTPALTELCIGHFQSFNPLTSFFNRSGFNLTSFKVIRYIRSTLLQLVPFLRHFPNLCTLAVDGFGDDEAMFSMKDLIAALVASPPESDILCPLLTSLSLGDFGDLLVEVKLRSALVEMVRTRSMEGAPYVIEGRCAYLKSFSVYGNLVKLRGAAHRIRSMGIQVEALTGEAARRAVNNWRNYYNM
ncbi:hypothetical protein MIND_00628600 [Mycena indigotica]|uniref:Uncharacterized protein n=1 Tax=Mycena indigotica TaxID=2126181 RepID=A0A8H6W3W0_9AGAR|nr:uncharacterized protein MIND_00628600 [Mycena indigotica]KAF7303977.1 hypothetical protein MIND_00628600 [Mycena indigotica]